ncbi:Uncharacterised protein [Porphyromonas cangingivalis]|nr:Uncharacterised protein [Porphyromonas cangingivalis]
MYTKYSIQESYSGLCLFFEDMKFDLVSDSSFFNLCMMSTFFLRYLRSMVFESLSSVTHHYKSGCMKGRNQVVKLDDESR